MNASAILFSDRLSVAFWYLLSRKSAGAAREARDGGDGGDRGAAVGTRLSRPRGRAGIPRDDQPARLAWFARNFQFFGAPAAYFVTVDRRMGPPQWADLGMYLQNLMLLAVEAGLATCPQECWAMYPATVETILGTPAARMLFCGVAIGWEDESDPANRLRSERAPEEEWLTVRT